MRTFLSDDFRLQEVTRDDLTIASICWGFTLGFGFLTTWKALKQSSAMYQRYGLRRLSNAYVWMIWSEIAVCLAFSVVCWLYLRGIIAPSFAFYFSVLTLWALQVQLLLQIIINRVGVLMLDRKRAKNLKYGVAILITLINISVYCIWVPARLQTSKTYIKLNDVWDRCEKVIYLVVDAALNWFFVRVVRRNLVKPGLKKYESLVRFNLYIIGFSLAMDVLIIAMMSLKNSFVYMQFHPLAYIVKLNIEMTMSELISKVARAQNNPHGAVMPSTSTGDRSGGRSRMTRTGDDKTLTQSKIHAFTGRSEDMEMGILEDSGPPHNNLQTQIEADNSSTDGSDRDDESIDKSGGFVVRRKQEFHVRVEQATPSPNADTDRRLHDAAESSRGAEPKDVHWRSY
ncbi:hypothetical protein D6C90_06870 [Aureobasidium pullulans]|uniref:Integral membrane protein n=1 Tax=Aureobasidium pullulans TaxID=5580 RepID=A0A4S9UEQ4_AURPU|nr:hypothetical protein D6C90_06870 [Aureobasidium pullulans]